MDIALANTSKSQRETALQYNKRTRDKDFSVGDQVLILIRDLSHELSAQWIGPGVIVSIISPYFYVVMLDDGSTRKLHANKLRLYISRVKSGVVFEDQR